MAQKRMFDRAIIETDNFLNVSMSAKALYFLLGMEADDEGFVSPKRVLRLYGGEMGDIKNLIDVGLVIPFESGVLVITHWNENNWLDSRRIKATQYQNEKSLLTLTDTKTYVLSNGLASAKPEERRGEENSTVERRTEQKKKFGEFQKVQLSDDELTKLRNKYGVGAVNRLVDELDGYLETSGKRYKSHYATLLNWARRKNIEVVVARAAPEEVVLPPELVEKNKERIAAVREALAEKLRMKT